MTDSEQVAAFLFSYLVIHFLGTEFKECSGIVSFKCSDYNQDF